MQSNNPIFARSDGFNGRYAQSAQGYGAAGTTGYTDPSTWQTGLGEPTGGVQSTQFGAPRRMTVETVVHKTAITLLVTFAAAFATWWFIGPLVANDGSVDSGAANLAYTLSFVGAIVGFGLAMVNSFKRVISPALVIAYALVEGVFVGAFSKTVTTFIGGGDSSLVLQAVLGTMAAFAGTLTVYRVFNIKVTNKFRRGVVAALFGFVGLALVDMVLGMFNADFGFNGYGTFGMLTSVVAVGLGVLLLILDFDSVERGVAAGLPERESWRAAFGLTVTLIWIYVEILRLVAIFSSGD